MAKVNSTMRLSGTVGGITYRQTEFGSLACDPGGPQPEEVLHKENYSMPRRYASEFKLLSKDSALLRRALGRALEGVQRTSLNGHMNSLIGRMQKKDMVNPLGYRHAGEGDVNEMKGFDLSETLLLEEALRSSYTHTLTLDNGVGTARLEVPAFMAWCKKNLFPEGATHIRIVSCASIVDFKNDGYANHIGYSELLPLSKKTRHTISMEHCMKVEPGECLLHVVGVEFYCVERGKTTLLRGGALQIVDVVRREVPVAAADAAIDHRPKQVPVANTVLVNGQPMQVFTYKELEWSLFKYFRRLPDRDIKLDYLEGNKT